MEPKPVIVEKTYNAPIERVWKALTDKDQMKEWYFDLAAFKAEPGFEFDFFGGSEEMQYRHLCKVIEANAPVKLSYSWKYEDFPGSSLVTFDLFKIDENSTTVKITHTGLESFPQDNKDFDASSFNAGWEYILGKSLDAYLKR